MLTEIRQVYFCRCPYTYKSVYKFQWIFTDERMLVYSEPIFRTEALAQADLDKFVCKVSPHPDERYFNER